MFEIIAARGPAGIGAPDEPVDGSEGRGRRCPVCHSGEVALDAVERGPQVWMQLAECGHCDHRWTLPEPSRSARGTVRARRVDAAEEGVRAA